MARRKPRAAAAAGTGPFFAPITAADKANIRRLIKENLGWDHEPREMQIQAAIAQLEGKDVLVHAATGMGKTAIVAAPHAFPQNKGRVTIFVSPLIALQEEMVKTFLEEFGLRAIAVNSTRRKSLNAIMQDICAGIYAVVLISPEMLQTRRFIDAVLRNNEFSRRVLSLVVDEAHTVSHWGAHFRKKYGTLGTVRAFLAAGTSVVALSASLTPRVRRDVLQKLQFGSGFLSIDLGNNRPNVSIVVRACHRLLGSYADLDFVIPDDVLEASDIPPTFVYADNKEDGAAIVDHLRDRLPEDMRQLGLVRPFNASLSHDYRKSALQHFKAGNIRVLVCTDAAGMGCNLPNIELVVQWKLPEKLSMFVQRAGRAARRPGMQGLAVLLVEPSAYTELPDSSSGTTEATEAPASAPAPAPPAKGHRKKSQKKQRRAPKGWAGAHGRSRGVTAADNDIDRTIQLIVNELAEDEGLLALVQTGDCRRRVIADAFDSGDKAASGACCDLCNPELLKRTLPGQGPKRKKRKAKDKEKNPAKDVVEALQHWRLKLWDEHFAHQHFAESALLSDDLIDVIARLPEPSSDRDLGSKIAGEWLLWAKFGKSLWRALASVYDARPPANQPQAKRKRAGSASQPSASPPAEHVDSARSEEPIAQALSAAAAHAPASVTAPAKRRRVQSGAPTETSAPGGSAAQVARQDPLVLWPAGWPRPTEIKLRKNQRVPTAVRLVKPPPAPVGDHTHPSRMILGTDGQRYFCHPDGRWWLLPPLPPHPPSAIHRAPQPVTSQPQLSQTEPEISL